MAAAITLVANTALSIEAPKAPQETLPGYRPENAYAFQSEVEALNVFLGDPKLSIPFGIPLPTGPDTKFLTLLCHAETLDKD